MFNPFKKKTILVPNYHQLWSTCKFDPKYEHETTIVCSLINKKSEVYKQVEEVTKVPWQLIAAIHYREASLSFLTCLHNGDPLPGPTTHVPKGRGPFISWESAAIDALQMEELPDTWTFESMLAWAEKYNGLGFRSRGLYSNYVWAGTDVYMGGMYVSDGKFDNNKFDKRIGVACIIKKLTFDV